jgi:hypothetical protein
VQISTEARTVEVDQVIASLDEPRHSLRDVLPSLPDAPGLYAIHGNAAVWAALQLGEPVARLPLYVGKAEDSLVTRDLKTHFGDGRTGSSTVRRTFAALLRTDLGFVGMPRNPAKPGHFSSYGLSPSDERRLTEWMRAHLEIAVWVTDRSRPLREIERDVLRSLNPPLNIQGVDHRWKARVQISRAVLAADARSWTPTG